MYQQDMFRNTEYDYLNSRIEEVSLSTNKQTRAIFALLNEMTQEIIGLKKKMDKQTKEEKHERTTG